MSAPFTATPAELALVNQIFVQVDKQKLGILSGDVAVQVFNGANLPGSVLREIWNIADEENNGWLSKTGAAKALRLIGHAQKGAQVSAALLSKPASLATIEGYTIVPQHNTGSSVPKSPPPGFHPLSSQDKIKFQNIFNRSGPSNGLLNGEKAREIFLKSKLSNDQLLRIWNLADRLDRGSLDIVDFTVAMYFIQGLMTQQISLVPDTLPPGLYEQAGGLPSNASSITMHLSGNSGIFSPLGSTFGRIQHQYTGQSQSLLSDHTGLSSQPWAPVLPARHSAAKFRPVSVAQEIASDAWDISSSEKTEAAAIISQELDTKNTGYIEDAVSYMRRSNLPSDDLALIWDLADTDSDGRLTHDEFVIAYHLIKKRMAGQQLSPQLRKQTSSLRTPPPRSDPPRDLLDLDDTPPPSAVLPQPTSILQPQSTGATGVPPIPPRNKGSDPFASSPFSPSPSLGAAVPNSGFIGDHVDHSHPTSPPLQDQSAEFGNLRNQLQSTNKSLDARKAERAKLESTLTSQAAELTALQTQLSSAKAAHDTETALLLQLKERFTTQSADIQKTKEELIRSESDLSAIRVEKAETEQAFLRDKEEARDLHKRMIEVGQQADQLRGEIEKAKKEAKQQKGRLAIARKQLSTKEAEKTKAENELRAVNIELQAIIEEAEKVETQVTQIEQLQPPQPLSQDSVVFAAAQPLPASPELISPNKCNNPFERLVMSYSPSPRSQSPFLPFGNTSVTSPSFVLPEHQNGQANQQAHSGNQSSFDDFFGVHETDPESAGDQTFKPDTQANGDSVPKEIDIDSAARVSPVTATSTEQFVTPPATVINEAPTGSSENLANAAEARFPSVDDTATPFPPLDDDNARKKDTEQPMTDLETHLRELEVDESGSDDSDSDDDSPLAEVVQKAKGKGSTPVTSVVAAGAVTLASTGTVPEVHSNSSFDDIFGADEIPATSVPASVPTSTPDVPKPPSGPFDSIPIQPSEPLKSNNTAGANAFDETLGGFSPPPTAKPAQFTFDEFEDSFDFGSAGGAQVTALPRPVTTATPVLSVPPPDAHPPVQSSLEDIFMAPNPAANGQQQTSTGPISNGSSLQGGATAATFDSAFANFGANPNLNLEASFASSTSANTAGEPQTPSSSRPFPTSGPASPKAFEASPRPSVNRTSSPGPRPASPPARMTSPVPRKSTSSKDSHEKLKEPTTRHSKLSIRFPFGKKRNKTQDSMPPPSALSPPPEEPTRIRTPASDDDVEPVKQITAMGFSRDQAIEALEKYGYDVTRAINSLLQ